MTPEERYNAATKTTPEERELAAAQWRERKAGHLDKLLQKQRAMLARLQTSERKARLAQALLALERWGPVLSIGCLWLARWIPKLAWMFISLALLVLFYVVGLMVWRWRRR